MQTKKALLLTMVMAVGFGFIGAVAAGDNEPQEIRHQVIALKTGDFELAETDISDLAVGESETIVTESGKTIDLLRTVDGLEIYVDGQLLDMPFSDTADLHGAHDGLHKEIQIVCTSEEDCDEISWINDGEDIHVEVMADGDASHTITKEIIIECSSDDDCEEQNIWVSTDGDITELEDIEGEVRVIRLHDDIETEHHEGASKVIRIHKKTDQN